MKGNMAQQQGTTDDVQLPPLRSAAGAAWTRRGATVTRCATANCQ